MLHPVLAVYFTKRADKQDRNQMIKAERKNSQGMVDGIGLSSLDTISIFKYLN